MSGRYTGTPLARRRPRGFWREVERVHKLRPQWGSVEIASELDCAPEYVRATAKRHGWHIGRWIKASVDRLIKLRVGNESPAATLERILVAAELSEAAYREKIVPRYRDEKRERRAEERRHYLQTGALD